MRNRYKNTDCEISESTGINEVKHGCISISNINIIEIKSKIYSFNLRLVLMHILHSQDVFFSEFAFYIGNTDSVHRNMKVLDNKHQVLQ